VGVLSTEWTIVLDDGTYYTIHSIISEIQRSVTVISVKNDFPVDRFVIQMQYANRHKRVKILFTRFAFKGIWFYFSDDLATMLGFESSKYYRYKYVNADNEIYAERPVLLSPGTANVYVYCDLLEHVMVGDIKALLLRIVNRKTDESTTQSNIPPSIRYSTCRCRKSPSTRSTSYWRWTTDNRCRLCRARQ